MYEGLREPYEFEGIPAMMDRDNITFDSKGRASPFTSNFEHLTPRGKRRPAGWANVVELGPGC